MENLPFSSGGKRGTGRGFLGKEKKKKCPLFRKKERRATL